MSQRRMEDLEAQLLETGPIRRQAGEYPARKHRFTILLAIVTTFILSATIFFAYNCSLTQPVVPALRFALPVRNVFVLTLLTQLTIFALAELTSTVLDLIRWAFSCSARGVSAFTFLALSRATNVLGVFYLVLGSTHGSNGFSGSGHRLWGGQRLALGVLLLSDISFQSAHHIVHQFPVQNAGLAPMALGIIEYNYFPYLITPAFWWYFPAILLDGRSATPMPPPSPCSRDTCTSYFLPGYITTLTYENGNNLTSSNYSTADTFITIDAPGYQLDFRPPAPDDPPVTLHDCQIYGYQKMGIEICLKQIDNSTFIAGTPLRNANLIQAWAVCPPDVQNASQCLVVGLPWQAYAPLNTKMTISSRRATTAFDRRNGTITEIMSLSDPTPTNYTVKDFFTFYDIMFYLNTSSPAMFTSTNYDFILSIANYFQTPLTQQIDQESTISTLQQFLAASIVLFNPASWPGVTVAPLPDNMGKQAALGISSTRLVIAPYTLYSFIAGGFLSLAWCVIALVLILMVATPNLSLYPEVDVAAKVIHENSRYINRQSHYSISGLLSSLSNAGTKEIRRQMAFARFYTRILMNAGGREDQPPVVIALQESDKLQQLTRRSVLIYGEG